VAPVDLVEKGSDYGINAKRMAMVAEIRKDLHLTWHEVCGQRASLRCFAPDAAMKVASHYAPGCV
jgi:hypothetical protein